MKDVYGSAALRAAGLKPAETPRPARETRAIPLPGLLTWRNGFPEIIPDPSLPAGTIELRYGAKAVERIVNLKPE